jgi:hypothetical protein
MEQLKKKFIEIALPQAAEVKSGWRGVRIVGAFWRFLRYD